MVQVDQGRPSAWRDEPFYSEIKQWSNLGSIEMHQIVVTIGRRTIVIFPDRDVDLGQVADDDRILVGETWSESGPRLEALKLKADDPRIQGISPGVPLTGRAAKERLGAFSTERPPTLQSDSSDPFNLSGMSDEELEAIVRLHQERT